MRPGAIEHLFSLFRRYVQLPLLTDYNFHEWQKFKQAWNCFSILNSDWNDDTSVNCVPIKLLLNKQKQKIHSHYERTNKMLSLQIIIKTPITNLLFKIVKEKIFFCTDVGSVFIFHSLILFLIGQNKEQPKATCSSSTGKMAVKTDAIPWYFTDLFYTGTFHILCSLRTSTQGAISAQTPAVLLPGSSVLTFLYKPSGHRISSLPLDYLYKGLFSSSHPPPEWEWEREQERDHQNGAFRQWMSLNVFQPERKKQECSE